MIPQKRIIPILLLQKESLVKTVQYKKPKYIGDPINTVRIFNELEVDELFFLDIYASKEKKGPHRTLLSEIAKECFMPLGYGGGINDITEAKSIFKLGYEKISINSKALENKEFITQLAEHFGSQAIIVSVDVKKNFWGKYKIFKHIEATTTSVDPVEWVQEIESLGAGEILLTNIDREGTWEGFDMNLVKQITSSVSIPVIIQGGAGNVGHIKEVLKSGYGSAIGLGSILLFQKKNMGVLVNFPDLNEIK